MTAKSKPKQKTIKATFAIYMENNGDGSASARFFSDEKAAEAYAEPDDERFCDDIYTKTLEFDENGVLLTPNPVRR